MAWGHRAAATGETFALPIAVEGLVFERVDDDSDEEEDRRGGSRQDPIPGPLKAEHSAVPPCDRFELVDDDSHDDEDDGGKVEQHRVPETPDTAFAASSGGSSSSSGPSRPSEACAAEQYSPCRLSPMELRLRLAGAGGSSSAGLEAREELPDRQIPAEPTIAEPKIEVSASHQAPPLPAEPAAAGPSGPPVLDYSRFERIDDSDEEPDRPAANDEEGSAPEQSPNNFLYEAFKAFKERAYMRPPSPPAPECHPIVECNVDGPLPDGPPWQDEEDPWCGGGEEGPVDVLAIRAAECEGDWFPRANTVGPAEASRAGATDAQGRGAAEEEARSDTARSSGHRPVVAEDPPAAPEPLPRESKEPTATGPGLLDVDGWPLEATQLCLVQEAADDLLELRTLQEGCARPANRERLERAIGDFEVRLRMRRTWTWFPLERYTWSGYEYENPVITVDFSLAGAGSLPAEDIHCSFGTDWFDLKVWGVPDVDGAKYHYRARMTQLMRDIVPSQCSVKAKGNHVYVRLQKTRDPRHGYCAWPDLCAGKGRKPFKYQEEAADGGLMDFLEGEFEKYEGHDSYRRDIGRAMEQVHRGEPVRGIPNTPQED